MTSIHVEQPPKIPFETLFVAHLNQLSLAEQEVDRGVALVLKLAFGTLVGGAVAIEALKMAMHHIDLQNFALGPEDVVILLLWAWNVIFATLMLGGLHIETLRNEVKTILGGMHQHAEGWDLAGNTPRESVQKMMEAYTQHLANSPRQE